MKQIWQQYRIHLFLLIALFLALPLLSLFQRTMFWDMTLVNLPWRYHLSECLHNGELPLWNPWMNYGFPQMGHYETWYPVSWLFALLFEYNIDTLQYEYLFNLFMAGVGFYKLSSLFTGLEKSTRLIGAIAYMLCGVFIAQASQLGYITSGAWMTFVFYYLVVFLRQPTFKNGLFLTFFYYLLITGGYPGNFIAITYLCLLITAIYIIRKFIQKRKDTLKPLLLYIPLMSIILLLMYAVVLVASGELQQYMTRASLDYTNTGFGAMTGSTSLSGYLTLVAPSASCSKSPFWGDYFMLNDVYFGLLNFLVVLYFLIRGNKSRYYKIAWLFFISSVLFMMISVATVFPIHKALYELVPYFNRFRFPSLFRIFFVLQLIFVVMFGWQWIKESEKARREFGWFVLILFIGSVVTLFFCSDHNLSFNHLITDFSQEILNLNQAGFLLLDAVIALLIYVGWFFGKNVNHANLTRLVLILLVVDLSFHTWILSPRFVSSSNDPAIISQAIDTIPSGFPLPDQNTPMKEAHLKYPPIPGLGFNTFAYYKYPQHEGASPYATHTFRDAIQSGVITQMLEYPLLAIFEKIKDGQLNDSDYLKRQTLAVQPLTAGPNDFTFKIDSCAGKFVVFNHNYYPHWNFYENGYPLKTQLVEGNFYAIQLQENDTALAIRFEPNSVVTAFYVSAVSFLIVLLLIIWFSFTNLRLKLKNEAP